MRRCLQLALLGAGHVAPNPMVGAVLVHEDRIIGEGYHQLYGQAHAEVNCLASVKEEDRPLISFSTLYVSLEPCAHHGKTPPCANLIVERQIPRVVIGCRDPFPAVNGKGIEILRSAGVEVGVGVLEGECRWVNRRFFAFYMEHRPFIVLKWAQSANGKMAAGIFAGNGKIDAEGGTNADDGGQAGTIGSRTRISNDYTNRLVHKWRSEEASILVGPRTALLDDPALTVRWWNGPNPIRLVIDKDLQLPPTLQLFDRSVPTIIFNNHRQEGELGHGAGGHAEGAGRSHRVEGKNEHGGEEGHRSREEGQRMHGGERNDPSEGKHNLVYYQLAMDSSLVHQLAMALYQLKIQSVLVEGGVRLLQSFIDEGYWDEARVITNTELEIPVGLASPVLENASLVSRETILSDTVRYYKNAATRGGK